MLCYADTVVKVKHVKQYERDGNLLVVWALGAYPVEREDYDIEMTLFVLNNLNDRDFETQAIFKKNNFYLVGGKIVPVYFGENKKAKMTVSTSTHMTILSKVMASNKCPLKVSLIGIPQEIPREPKDDENSVIYILVNDYAGQEYNFIVKVVFPYHNSHFTYLKNIVQPHESLIFVVGQLEIIDNNFYVYARDINFIDACFINKKKSFDSNLSQVSSSRSLICFKLLVTHQNAIDGSNEKTKDKLSALMDLNNNISNKSEFHLADNFHSSKHVRIEDVDEIDKSCLVNTECANIDSCVKESNNLNNFEFKEFKEVGERSGKGNRNQKEIVHDHGKGKEHLRHSLCSNLRTHGSNAGFVKDEE
ncbi:16601_t:CDS:2 [Cetraspora pellucida]|uniref:16601_t:CDS:1 n=1 Tax=Cetraspora pellucida TaxID=1433469 RepID=A0ACA9NQ49_9GLOM|nr:16601_t:CDS:2 [Cetraspora pellucida]